MQTVMRTERPPITFPRRKRRCVYCESEFLTPAPNRAPICDTCARCIARERPRGDRCAACPERNGGKRG